MLFLLNGSPRKWKKSEAFPNETPNHNVGYVDQVFAPPSRSKGQLKSFSAPFSAVEVHGFDFFSPGGLVSRFVSALSGRKPELSSPEETSEI